MSKYLAFAFVASVAVAVPANAVTVSTIAANFQNAVGGSNKSFIDNGPATGNDQFRWGQSTGDGQNIFDFNEASTPINVALNSQFDLGTFSYTNRPTTGDTLTSIDLRLRAGISGGVPSTNDFLFKLGVEETTNQRPCSYPSGNNPCADRVTVNVLNGTGTFTSGGTAYTLTIDGFRDSTGAFSTSFIGQENATTLATVVGRFTSVAPEPASWAMMVGGFGLLGGALRRRARSTQVRFA